MASPIGFLLIETSSPCLRGTMSRRHLQLPTWRHSVILMMIAMCPLLSVAVKDEGSLKTAVFLSPKFVMTPGSVVNRFYHNIEFPKGHIGIKSFNAEVVDSSGIPVPLKETYLHHWVVGRYYQRKGAGEIRRGNGSFLLNSHLQDDNSDYIYVRNNGICQNLGQYFGLGSETRKTPTDVPDTYAIEVGNPDEIPDGYEDRWLLNVHAIDTRGVVDKLGCTECRCDLYNVSIDEYNRPLKPGYVGGLYCCYDQTQCRLKPGFETASRELYLRYTVQWMDWNTKLLPVQIFIFDVTDSWESVPNVSGGKNQCLVEYEVEACESSSGANNGSVCIHSKKTSFIIPRGGHVVYGVAHQHSGGAGSSLYGEDGRVICSSIPTYGKGEEAGNEAGYIVGMSTCYPQPGSVNISQGETLVLVSNYSSTKRHTGVMGLFYILVADQLPVHKNNLGAIDPKHWLQSMNLQFVGSALLLLGALLVLVASVVGCQRRIAVGEDGYRPIRM